MNKPPPQLPDDPLRPHTYDGIQEYDNRLPNWWLWTFYGAIIFSVIYWFTWHDSRMMLDDHAVIDQQMAEVEEIRLAAIGTLDSETLWQMSRNSGFVAGGAKIYQEKCLSCHGAQLQGGIGVSLVDNQWLWGNTPMSMYHVVSAGSPNKMSGMQAWISELGPQKVSQVVAFVLSHHQPDALARAESANPPIAQ
jgi:cytochrome c oxidase cbb3-type subunit III